MTFYSVLFRLPDDDPSLARVTPASFVDLHLDFIVEAIVKGKEKYELRPFFESPLRNLDAILYRNEVMRDLEKSRIYDLITAFADGMSAVRESLSIAKKSSYPNESNAWVLDAVHQYCEGVRRIADGLSHSDVDSRGLRWFREWLGAYVQSEPFVLLLRDTTALLASLEGIAYRIRIRSGSFTVLEADGERDLVSVIQKTFERFRQGSTKSYSIERREQVLMNGIEAKVLEFVGLLNPDTFAALTRFAAEHREFIDDAVRRFDREIQFYVACTDYFSKLADAGLPTCYAHVHDADKSVRVDRGFDLALAAHLLENGEQVVLNGFSLTGVERVLVVSGPNQGGKTTFARMFGQMHYLAALGCRVAGSMASTFLFDEIFTHFEREEAPGALRGKLEDDLIRIHDILDRATEKSVIILNEIFSSTTAQDATILAMRVMKRILEIDVLCVCVTFIDELASLGEKTVSMVSRVDPRDPAVRTYRIERGPANGLAYAMSLAEKYSLTYDRLKQRLSAKRTQ